MRSTVTIQQTLLAVACAFVLGAFSASASALGANENVAAPVAQYLEKAIPAPLVVYERVAFDASVLFDSNQSDLRAAGRDTLDGFIAKIRGMEAQSVMAIGYVDRMDTTGSNQILSEERVAAVKAYLVSRGVAADRVRTSGWGDTRPTTYATECKDTNHSTSVACMQPDRHVFIEISGSRPAQ
jgi:OmpA-OmpF porin, OOP family